MKYLEINIRSSSDQGAPGHSSGGAATMGSWPLDLKKVNVEIFLSSRRNEKGTPLYWQKQVYHVLPVVGSSIISYNFEVFFSGRQHKLSLLQFNMRECLIEESS